MSVDFLAHLYPGRPRGHQHQVAVVWKPIHLQPVFAEHPVIGGKVAEEVVENGLSLPSGLSMTDLDRERVVVPHPVPGTFRERIQAA